MSIVCCRVEYPVMNMKLGFILIHFVKRMSTEWYPISFFSKLYVSHTRHMTQDLHDWLGDGCVQVPSRTLEEETIRSPQISASCTMLAVQAVNGCAQNHTTNKT